MQAKAIYQHINCAIRMIETIECRAAIKFADGFYDALISGINYQDIFEFGYNSTEESKLL